jgi:hypothetical protein
MKLLTEDAVFRCGHDARVNVVPTQTLVRIVGRRALVENDPEARPISMCPNIGGTMKPCTLSRKVDKGYSTWVRIDGHFVCLETVDGLTDGTLPDSVHYTVREPGQDWVAEAQ